MRKIIQQQQQGRRGVGRRGLLLLWLVTALGGLSGGRAPVPVIAESEVADVAPSVDAVALELVLGWANPDLTASERRRIATAVLRSSDKYGLDPELVAAVILVESGARPWVRSPKGAIGLMQIMPHMLEPLAVVGNFATIETNIEVGCWILAGNIARLGEADGVSAYFWGSDIRSEGYLRKVLTARAEMRKRLQS